MRRPLLIHVGIVAIPTMLFIGLLWNYLGLSGVKHVRYEMGDPSPFVNRLLPDERVGDVLRAQGDTSVTLLDEPVYFSVFPPPGNWETAEVSLAFQLGDHAFLELGALKDLFAQAYDFRPMANTVIEGLEENGWVGKTSPKLGESAKVFFRNETFANNPALVGDAEVATYRTPLPWVMPAGETAGARDQVYAWNLEGPHELFTAIGDGEAFELTVRFHDTNRVPGSDEGAVRIFSQGGEVVAQEFFPDDGNTLGDAKESAAALAFHISPDGLPSGVYRIVLSSTSDIVFDEFVTRAKYLVVKNTIKFASDDELIAVVTNAKKVTLEALSQQALGTATFGKTPLDLTTIGEKRSVTSPNEEIAPVLLPGGGVKVTGEGFFSLANRSFFAPEPSGFINFLVAPEAYTMLVAQVTEERVEDGWRVASSSFDLATLAQERGAYKFVLSAPLVHEEGGDVTIHTIDVTFRKPPLTFRGFLSSLKRFAYEVF